MNLQNLINPEPNQKERKEENGKSQKNKKKNNQLTKF